MQMYENIFIICNII